jgi:hypothetical protein
MSSEIIPIVVACDNYDSFQYTSIISIFEGLFNDETNFIFSQANFQKNWT